jgi:hypothetical protein
MLAGCVAFPPLRLSACEQAGTARFHAIPIASRADHALARQFSPEVPGNCLIHLLRERSLWASSRGRRVDVVLTAPEAPLSALPADPAALAELYGARVREIHDGVYALWEVPPGDYRVDAVSVADYGRARLARERGAETGSWVSGSLTCVAGAVLFLAVGDAGAGGTVVLRDMAPGPGRDQVLRGLRSAGLHAGAPGYRDCELRW